MRTPADVSATSSQQAFALEHLQAAIVRLADKTPVRAGNSQRGRRALRVAETLSAYRRYMKALEPN